ncbi:MAG: SDR family oxidoreductase [Deltaproteobacteria bacterium]|nr:SDR family oxidoreductase [Deltaproteobacteria bacterium]
MGNREGDLWAIIVGGSSGFGLASAKALAEKGFGVCVVHRDRRGAMQRIEQNFSEIKRHSGRFLSFNVDALSAEARDAVLCDIAAYVGTQKIRLLLHSIAYGSVKPLAPLSSASLDENVVAAANNVLQDDELMLTLDAMAGSLWSWTREIFERRLFTQDARVIGLTSEGSSVAWRCYAAVGAAKAALEAISRSIAKELGPHGVRSNIIQAGITDTPALRLIPGCEQMLAQARARNPLGRLTQPQDIAKIVAFLASDEAAWINGSVIRVDGGEHICGSMQEGK